MATFLKDLKINGKQPDEITYESKDGRFSVHAWGVWPKHSVLAGQACKQFKDSFDTVKEVLEAYPEAKASHEFCQPVNTFDHLSDKGDY